MQEDIKIKEKIEKEIILNAIKNKGKINEKTIIGVLLKENKSLKEKIKK